MITKVEIIRCACKIHNGEGVEVPKGGGLARLASGDDKAARTAAHNLVNSVRLGLHRTASGKASGPWPIGTHSVVRTRDELLDHIADQCPDICGGDPQVMADLDDATDDELAAYIDGMHAWHQQRAAL
ncbi:hypothetical protein [Nonomuraea sp. NEAU-A123]|uniref:hypothetical protein n=1 Tax=Nonomuraea sp. NEAU-A123 TaxID=2839649 RepID=UPI001BE4B783|nr:hypothetical protein [Nonomuraea sp. NEAU-A123]MBT2226280.1 hypothetical protein [Nonomuraea sp. NEAU-A123]